jgi:hypothetical protein
VLAGLGNIRQSDVQAIGRQENIIIKKLKQRMVADTVEFEAYGIYFTN